MPQYFRFPFEHCMHSSAYHILIGTRISYKSKCFVLQDSYSLLQISKLLKMIKAIFLVLVLVAAASMAVAASSKRTVDIKYIIIFV